MKSAVMFWDLGGQTGLRSIWDKYYADSHAIIYVVDASSPERFPPPLPQGYDSCCAILYVTVYGRESTSSSRGSDYIRPKFTSDLNWNLSHLT